MKKILFTLMVAALPSLAAAEEIEAKVSGLVCAYCVQGIEKAFRSEAMVEHVKVDLDNGRVSVRTKGTGDLPDDKVRSIITDAGYTLTDIARK